MTKIFQRLDRGYNSFDWRSLLTILNRLLLQCKSVWVDVAGLKAGTEVNLKRQLLRKSYKKTAIAFPRFRRSIQYPWISAVLVFLLIVFSQFPQQLIGVANAATTIQPPLSTNGSKIVDAKGTTVLLRGINWFGIETETHTPHGLWVRDYKDMLTQIKKQGYNIIRLPYSVQALSSTDISGVDFSIGSNSSLYGKTPLEVMDVVIAEAQKQGLMILLDSHRLKDYSGDQPDIPELWYDDSYTEAAWIKTWTDLAKRYKNRPNVIGADLKNEPHGKARWGNNNRATDWRLAAERCGKAIQAVNPNWLIVVEGIGNVSEKNQWYWDGGNLVGVKQYPVRLTNTKKLVYSVHEYGSGVYDAPWFSDPTFPNNLPSRWETGFNYIATQKIAPILVGEFGGRQVDTSSKEGIWQRKFVQFIGQKGLSFTYWAWNPNSSDTGGILMDDWRTVDAPKQQLLKTLLSGIGFTAS